MLASSVNVYAIGTRVCDYGYKNANGLFIKSYTEKVKMYTKGNDYDTIYFEARPVVMDVTGGGAVKYITKYKLEKREYVESNSYTDGEGTELEGNKYLWTLEESNGAVIRCDRY